MNRQPTGLVMIANVIVWDIETVPDLRGFAAAKGLVGMADEVDVAEIGDKFPSSSTTLSFA